MKRKLYPQILSHLIKLCIDIDILCLVLQMQKQNKKKYTYTQIYIYMFIILGGEERKPRQKKEENN